MRSTIRLGNVVGKTQYLFGVRIVPLHGDFNTNGTVAAGYFGFASGVKNVRMQYGLGTVYVLHKSFYSAKKSEVFVLGRTLINQPDFHPVIQKR